MKCKNCGGEIRLEDLYCPYCGTANTQARQHAVDMKKYQADFQQTKQDVTQRAGRESRRAVRIAAIAFLLLAIAANIFIQANSFMLNSILEEHRLSKNTEQLLQEADRYLDEEDYIGFSSYYYKMRLGSYNKNYARYYPLYRVSQSYRYAAQQIMQLVNPRRYSNIAHITKYTSEYIQSFYESLDPDNYSYYEDYESEWTQRHIANMKESMEALLIAYLGMTSEEARSMPELSRGNRALLVERGLAQYEEQQTP